jgi:hypothetical protein
LRIDIAGKLGFLAQSLYQQGKFAEAAKWMSDPTKKREYEKQAKAYERLGEPMCLCPITMREQADPNGKVWLVPSKRETYHRVYAVDEEIRFVKCDACDGLFALSVDDEPSHLLPTMDVNH